MNIFKKLFSKKEKEEIKEPIKLYEPKESCELDGTVYHLGDRVICRSNEYEPLLVGELVEFWDNEGKWTNCIPQVKADGSGQVYGVMGIIRPYSEELIGTLIRMNPLEQWNHFVDEPYKYSEEQIERKKKQQEARQKVKESYNEL